MPRGIYPRPSLAERFWARVKKIDSGCWEWQGSTNGVDYGQIQSGGRNRGTHIISYEWAKGLVPDGLEIDHLCRNSKCVNPDHLEAVTHSTNVLRGESPRLSPEWQRRKTHCPQGHPYSIENTNYHKGQRHCRICNREATRRRRQKLLL